MKLPSFTRIIVETFDKEQRSWVSKLAAPLNNFMLTVRNGLDKNITVNDNLSGAIKTVSVVSGAASFKYTSSRPPKCVIIGKWRNITDSTWTPSTGIAVYWTYSAENVINCTFYGLNNTDNYEMNLLILDD